MYCLRIDRGLRQLIRKNPGDHKDAIQRTRAVLIESTAAQHQAALLPDHDGRQNAQQQQIREQLPRAIDSNYLQ
ncbi:MAG: hypothetical protein C7B45_04300 [Sulfobacillus acidophilus]|uniref:Uncharacterized protein n=1 Tax=Sulfobacillus acidophilus TaxID=53633 RepID=A0A2T2WLP3_9FIRM|nr:MAG: hypothetical protein C7B45_04300 [Sulfobacillus acidophilus]